MSRRLLSVVAVLLLAALSVHAADPARSRVAALPLEEAPQFDLRALFDRAPGVIDTSDGVTMSAFAFEVVVVRIGPDGQSIKACVDSEEAARKFLATPVEKLQRAEGHKH
jgi:hypothetical protein